MSSIRENEISGSDSINRKGELFVVGIGPGGKQHRTFAAVDAIESSEVVVGYTTYINLVSDLLEGKEIISNGMRQEVERVREAIKVARTGKRVALISSGDAGVYGMAGLAMELAEGLDDVEVISIPGVTAANTAANSLGAPLMLDYAVVSLSDLLVPWDQIVKRLDAIASAGMVVALYNPRSKKRIEHLNIAIDTFLKHRSPESVAGVVTNAGCDNEHVVVTTLGELGQCDVGMRSMVIIGNEDAKVINGKFVLPRGYKL